MSLNLEQRKIVTSVLTVLSVVASIFLFVWGTASFFDSVLGSMYSGPSATAPIRENVVPFVGPSETIDAQGEKVRYGFIDRKGKLVINEQFDDASGFHEARAAVRVGQDWSFIDNTGQMLPPGAPAKFSRVRDFCEGLAAVRVGGKWGFVDRNCQWVIKPEWRHVTDFHNGFAIVSDPPSESSTGVIDRTGQYLVQQGGYTVWDESGGACRIRLHQLYGFLDASGHMLISPKYRNNMDYSDSLAAVQTSDGKWGFINLEGKLVIPADFDDCGSFKRGFACAAKQGRFGIVDDTGSWTIKPQFDFLSGIYLPKHRNTFASNGLFPFAENGAWGFMDRTGRTAIKPIYEDTDTFSEGMAVVGVLHTTPAPPPAVPEAEPVEKNHVVFAVKTIEPGQPIDEDSIEERVVDKPPVGTYSSVDELVGLEATKKISKGEMILDEEVGCQPEEDCESDFSNKIKLGQRAIALPITCPRLPPQMVPGTKIDVLALDLAGETPKLRSVIREAVIMALGDQQDEPSINHISAITVQVDWNDSCKLLKALASEKLYIAPAARRAPKSGR